MSTFAQPDSTSASEQFVSTNAVDESRTRSRRQIVLFMSIAVTAWAIVELASLVSRHTTGPELYGVLVALVAVAAGVLDLVALNSSRAWIWLIVAVVLWAVVALGGLAGVVAHVIGPSAEYGPVDPRPRPTLAPLVFTAIGVVGGLITIVGRRAGVYRPRTPGRE